MILVKRYSEKQAKGVFLFNIVKSGIMWCSE